MFCRVCVCVCVRVYVRGLNMCASAYDYAVCVRVYDYVASLTHIHTHTHTHTRTQNTQSFAKNFGLYGERVGCLSMVGKTSEEADRLLSQVCRGFFFSAEDRRYST